MWITAPYRHLASVDTGALTKAVLSLPETSWQADRQQLKELAFYRETNSIFLRSVDAQTFNNVLRERSLQEADITIPTGRESLQALVDPILEVLLEKLGRGGVVTRIQFARMRPGTRIMPHIDQSMMLVAAHRVHVPLTTNPGVNFDIGDNQASFSPGEMYEFNNRVMHSVHNGGNTDRIHLIIDYLR